MRSTTVTGKIGRPKKRSEINLTIMTKEYPNIEKLLLSKNRQELYDTYGIDLPRDLDWHKSSLKGLSHRASAILEVIARETLRKGATSADDS